MQYGSLPLGKNETFPDNFYLDRTDVREVNIRSDNKTTHLDLSHPLPGDWFAIAYIPDKDTIKLRPKVGTTQRGKLISFSLYHNLAGPAGLSTTWRLVCYGIYSRQRYQAKTKGRYYTTRQTQILQICLL